MNIKESENVMKNFCFQKICIATQKKNVKKGDFYVLVFVTPVKLYIDIK